VTQKLQHVRAYTRRSPSVVPSPAHAVLTQSPEIVARVLERALEKALAAFVKEHRKEMGQ
jgi:hypothetical protein